MLMYHGFPTSMNLDDEQAVFATRHVMLSHATAPEALERVARYAGTVALDNGAFTAWKQGRQIDIEGFYEWVGRAVEMPAVAWFLVPDVIDGEEDENDALTAAVPPRLRSWAVPVWHLHESIGRFARLCRAWPRVAIGSSGQWATPNTPSWWDRMQEAMSMWPPHCRLHGLRMADPRIVRRLPFASVDSTTAVRNAALDAKHPAPWIGADRATRTRAYCQYLEGTRAPLRPEFADATIGTLWELYDRTVKEANAA